MTLKNITFIDACYRRPTEYTPVWFMRQAGRYMPSYRRIKGKLNVTDLARDHELASEVAVDAVNQLGVDACILFADIMLPLEGIGIKFRIEENVGPVILNPILCNDDVNALGSLNLEVDVGYISDGIKATLQKLDDSVPLLGFSGAPFTLASYVIDGAINKDLTKTKQLMYGQPETWKALMEKLTRMVKDYVCFQVKSGVHAVQLFDSWAGCLSSEDYEQFVLKYTKDIFSSIQDIPKIHFCANSVALIEQFEKTGANVLSVDWRTPISEVWKKCKEQVAVQGNLDPAIALVGGEYLEHKILNILETAKTHNGHIFSLGHGVLKDTPPENLRQIINMVHKETNKRN